MCILLREIKCETSAEALLHLNIPHHDCTPLYTKSLLHIFTQRHTFFNPKVDEALLVSNSLTSPRSSLGVVDDLGNLAVLYWRTVVVSRGAEEQEGRLGSHRRLPCHLLQPFCAVMRVGSLTVKEWKSREQITSHLEGIMTTKDKLRTKTEGRDWPLRWHTQCSWHWAGFPQALWTWLGRWSLCRHSWNLCHFGPGWYVCHFLGSDEPAGGEKGL